MTRIPEELILKDFEEVIMWYDGPVIAVARDNDGNAYMMEYVSDEDDESVYLYCRLTDEKLASVKDGEVSLRSIYVDESNAIYKIVLPYNDVVLPSITPIRAQDIQEDWLPTEKSFLRGKK